MGRRHIISHQPFINADASIDQTQSPESVIDQIDKCSIIVEWANGVALAGNLFVDVRDYNDATGLYTAWSALNIAPGGSVVVSGASGLARIHLTFGFEFYNLRLRYVASAGTGNLTATIKAANVGA